MDAPTFELEEITTLTNGLALKLSEAPDMGKFNLYDGNDRSRDRADISLIGPGNKHIPLTAYWQEALVNWFASLSPLNSGRYSLRVRSHRDGLVSSAFAQRSAVNSWQNVDNSSHIPLITHKQLMR